MVDYDEYKKDPSNNVKKDSNGSRVRSKMPTKVKVAIKFGYDETMKTQLGDEDFISYMEDVITHNQAYWSHPSLGTEVIFEVSKQIVIRKYKTHFYL